jgi:pimeloyl-ACP methyl ester carboxylesterase
MKSHRIVGSGRVQLHAVETGTPRGRPILFLHGASQCWLQWSRQLESPLARTHRLVALDLRGHGLSDKPPDAYGDSRGWADDLDAVIRTLELEQPVVCGWSYGPLVFLDFIRHHGEERIGGLHFVGAVTKLGSAAAMSVLSPEFLAVAAQFLSPDEETCVRGLRSLLQLCFAREPPPDEMRKMLEYNVSVPTYVRQGLFSRGLDNDDVLARLRKPVLVTHGARDAIVNPAVVEQHRAAMPHARVEVLPGAGHAVFWDEATAFNESLAAFCASL